MHGQVVVCPGINDGDVLDDTLLGVLDRFPRLATVGVVPLGVSDHTTEAEMRPHTLARGRSASSTSWRSGRRASARCSAAAWCTPPTSTTCSPAGRFPPLDVYDGLPQHENGIGMAPSSAPRCGPHARRAGRRAGHPHRLLRLGRRRARRGLPSTPRPRRCETPVHFRAPRRRITILTGDVRRGGARSVRRRPRGGRGDAGRGAPRGQPVLRRQHRRHRAPHRRRPRRRVGRTRPPTVGTSSPTRPSRAAGSSTASRPPTCRGPVEIVATDGASLRGSSREHGLRTPSSPSSWPPERRQVHPREPHRRRRRDRSSRRSRGSPATARCSTPSGSVVSSPSSTPAVVAAHRGDGSEKLAKVSAQAERAARRRRRRPLRRRRDRRHHRGGRCRGPRRAPQRGEAGAARRQQGRRRQARAQRLGVRQVRPRRPVAGVRALHGRGTGDLLDALVEAAPGGAPGARGRGGRRQDAVLASPSWAVPTSASPRCSTSSLGDERVDRARHARHHPRRHRHRRRHRRRAAALRRHRRACAAGPRSTSPPSTTPWCAVLRGRSTAPTPPCW